MSEILKKACDECLADRGRENEELSQKLHDFIHENYELKGEPWNYTLIDAILDAWDKNPEFRELDGVFFRVQRNNKWQNICFSDLTEEEMDKILEGRNEEWLRNLCKILGQTIRKIGDELNISMSYEE